jgi:hypothetical protein
MLGRPLAVAFGFGTQVQPAGLARIDRDRYTILAIDLKVEGEVTAVIYAIDRVAHEISVLAKIVDLGQRKGEIPSWSSNCRTRQSRISFGW